MNIKSHQASQPIMHKINTNLNEIEKNSRFRGSSGLQSPKTQGNLVRTTPNLMISGHGGE